MRSPRQWLSIAPARASTIWSALLVYFGVAQLCLWSFLDSFPVWVYALGAVALTGLAIAMVRTIRAAGESDAGPSVATFLSCLFFALILFALGGEGRLFYSNIDWQVRYAVIRDMAIHPWPFVYMDGGTPEFLRAPIGMFLIPAIGWKAWGPVAADYLLLVQNSMLLAAALSLGASLFETRRQRFFALLVITSFSGLDIVGQYLTTSALEHRESWGATQFSSFVTQAFWVPNHALPSWIGILAFLCWHRGRWPLSAFLSILPLLALWSPLALMGLLPFAAYGAIASVRPWRIGPETILLPLVALFLATPSLFYLSAAAGSVGVTLNAIEPDRYYLFQAVELLPFLLPLFFTPVVRRMPWLLALAAFWLLIVPYLKIGPSGDFTMRASIPALAVLAYLVAEYLVRMKQITLPGSAMIVALSLGAFTGLAEISRALRHPPAPAILCSFYRAYDQSFGASKESYLAPLDRMPEFVRPHHPARLDRDVTAQCWNGDWYRPTGA